MLGLIFECFFIPPQLFCAGNVIYESYNTHTLDIQTPQNTIQGNLALGTIKEMADVSRQNLLVRGGRRRM